MNDLTLLTEFLGWCAVLNLILLTVSVLIFSLAGSVPARLHSKLFHIPEETLRPIYIQFLGYYKLGIILFNLMPYFALKIIA